MVAELAILLRVEHLEQRRRRIAAEIGAELVDLVEHHDGIARASLLDPLDDAAGQRADVGPAMPADLRLVAYTAERDAHELPPHRPRDRASERGLTDPRRTGEAENRTARILSQLANAEELEDSVLHDREMRVVVIEDLARLFEPKPIDRAAIPGQVDDPVEIIAHDLRLGPVRMHPLEPPQLANRLFAGRTGKIRFLDLETVVVELVGTRIGLAELALDRAQLLAQEGLAVILGRGLGGHHRPMKVGSGRDGLELALEQCVDLSQSREGVLDLEDFLGLFEAQAEIRCDEIGEASGTLHVRRDREDLGRKILERQQFLDARADGPGESLALDSPILAALFGRGEGRDADARALAVVDHRLDAGLAEALDEHLLAPVRHLHRTHHHRDRADAVEVVGIGIDRLGIALRDEQDQAIAGQGFFDGRDRMIPRNEERKHHVRKNDELAKCQDRKVFREMGSRGRAFHGCINGRARVDLRREIRSRIAN